MATPFEIVRAQLSTIQADFERKLTDPKFLGLLAAEGIKPADAKTKLPAVFTCGGAIAVLEAILALHVQVSDLQYQLDTVVMKKAPTPKKASVEDSTPD